MYKPIKIDVDKCQGCGSCVEECPAGALRLKDEKVFLFAKCMSCGACVEACGFEALSF